MTALLDDPYTQIEKQSLKEYVPLRAMLELTYRCNFRCVMCYLVEFRSPGELSTEEYQRVMDQLAEMGCLFLTLTGGEVLVRKDFFELARYAREKRFALRIFTNGLLIDDKAADQLRDIQPLSTEVSLYGMSDETYAAVTGRPGRYARVIQAIRRLRERDLSVIIKTPVIQQNYHDLDAMHAFAKEIGASFKANPNITPKDNGDFAPLAHALNDEQLEEYYRRYTTALPELFLKPEGLMCNTARSAMIISPMGDVFPCIQIKRSVGNVRERPLAEIWKGSPLLDKLRGLRVRDHAGCSGCGNGKTAQCAGISYMATGSYTGGDPLTQRITKIKEKAYQKQQRNCP
ncbi:MAG: radical SAM protein [Planctomycetota bacterium]